MIARALRIIAMLAASGAQAQSNVDIPVDQARTIATRAVLAGDMALAREIALQLLTVDPDDRTALIVIAATAPQMGDPSAGRVAGARAWDLSVTNAEKYEAARLTALAAANEGRFTLSTLWLRRALTVAPDDAEYARTIADARTVARRNPWSTSVGFSISPSNNVNGGAKSPTVTTNGAPTGGTLTRDALALEGIRATFNFRTQYRLHADASRRTTVALRYQGARVKLTEDVDIPDASFATNTFEGSVRYDHALDIGSYGLGFAVGRSDYRDVDRYDLSTDMEFYANVRISADYRRPLSSATEINLSTQAERLSYRNANIGDVDRVTLQTGIIHQLASGDAWRASLSYTDSDGDSVNYTSDMWTLQGAYFWKDPIGAVSLSVGAGLSWANYPDYQLLGSVAGGRQDTTVFYNVNIGFPDVAYAGFVPGVTVNHSISDSNVSRFTRDTLSVGLTVNSVF